MYRTRTILLFPKIFSIICSLLNLKKLLWEATLIWSWTVQKNKKGGNASTHRNPLKKVQNIANSLDLIDVWRTLNPDGKRFTWRRTKPEVHCRLDYFMISSSLITAITNADILPGYRTDHSLITIHLAGNNNPRGPGSGSSIRLFFCEYIELIKKNYRWSCNGEQKQWRCRCCPALLWDAIKMQILSS